MWRSQKWEAGLGQLPTASASWGSNFSPRVGENYLLVPHIKSLPAPFSNPAARVFQALCHVRPAPLRAAYLGVVALTFSSRLLHFSFFLVCKLSLIIVKISIFSVMFCILILGAILIVFRWCNGNEYLKSHICNILYLILANYECTTFNYYIYICMSCAKQIKPNPLIMSFKRHQTSHHLS